MIISPDAGRVKLTRKFAQMVGAPYALLEKERPAQQVAEIGYVIGDVKVQGRKAVIVDDIIDTGGTLAAGAQTVLDEGASEVYAVATHGLFSGNAFETLATSPLAGHPRHRHRPAARRRARPDPRADLRRHPYRLVRRIFTRRLRLRDLRGREPALLGRPRWLGSRAMYEFLLTVHVLAAVIWVGGGVAMHIARHVRCASAATSTTRVRVHALDATWLGPRLFAPMSSIVLVAGSLLVNEAGYDFDADLDHARLHRLGDQLPRRRRLLPARGQEARGAVEQHGTGHELRRDERQPRAHGGDHRHGRSSCSSSST